MNEEAYFLFLMFELNKIERVLRANLHYRQQKINPTPITRQEKEFHAHPPLSSFVQFGD
jgi:hypothetical protein